MPDLCLSCIGDNALKERLHPLSTTVTCTYCGKAGVGLSVEALAAAVDEPLRVAYRHGQVRPHYPVEADSPTWEQEGEELTFLLQEEVEIDDVPATALAQALVAADPADVTNGGEPFFTADQLYERAEVYDWDYLETWNAFAVRIKHRRRFFDSEAIHQLAQILGQPGSAEAHELPIATVGPDQEIQRVFRARRTNSADHARLILAFPANELTLPPPSQAIAGRMNPAGISVFYGALTEKVAVAEVRPPLGGIVIVGSFRPSRALRLLDLTKLGQAFSGSIFSSQYATRAARLRFLKRFRSLIAYPVQPSDEALEYLPTQAVSEYVGSVLGFDGILYASSQIGTTGDVDEYVEEGDPPIVPYTECNVAVFSVPPKQASDGPVEGRSDPRSLAPLLYDDDSAHGVWITRIAYEYSRIPLDDERGELLPDSEALPIDLADQTSRGEMP